MPHGSAIPEPCSCCPMAVTATPGPQHQGDPQKPTPMPWRMTGHQAWDSSTGHGCPSIILLLMGDIGQNPVTTWQTDPTDVVLLANIFASVLPRTTLQLLPVWVMVCWCKR